MLVAQLCPSLCGPMNYSPLGSSIHGILQARRLEWVAIPFSRRSSRPRCQTWVSCLADRCFAIWATRELMTYYLLFIIFILTVYRNKQTFLMGKNVLILMVPILINKDVFEPNYNDLKFMVRNHNYFCINLIQSWIDWKINNFSLVHKGSEVTREAAVPKLKRMTDEYKNIKT